ncbi:MAG TPA: hypothetical protein LFW21_01725 [Rickettsia endosymbiont of Pyrocoelia pectoralis]|nr:hypothetical protein [Rickettsia endosymbiont of Pyrocoelia pectoralis]
MKILIEPNKNILNNIDEQLRIKQERDLAQSYSRTFTSKDGMIVLEDLTEMSGICRSTFTSDPLLNAYNEGQKSSIFYIYSQVENNISNMEGNN